MKHAKSTVLMAALLLAGVSSCAAEKAPQPYHLIYLHGRIVQMQQDPRPLHPQFGYYEYEKILDTFRKQGFVVTAGIRPRSASVSESAELVVKQVRGLLDSGVPADHIVVLGASMGAGIALLASARLQNPDLRFCVLGTCLSERVRRLAADQGKGPMGRILAIREASDEVTASCPRWDPERVRSPGLTAREIVLDTGDHHGFLYRPLPSWVAPVSEWVKGTAGEPVGARKRVWDFEDVALGKLPEGWKAEGTNQRGPLATWKVVEDATAPSGKHALALTAVDHPFGGTFNLCWTDRLSFLDGRISVRFKAVKGEEDQGGGVIWRARDKENYYIARFNPLENNFRIYYVRDGARKTLASTRVALPAGKWHSLEITQKGHNFEGYLDGKKLLEGESDRFTTPGGVGLWTKADAVTSFDKFSVSPLGESAAS